MSWLLLVVSTALIIFGADRLTEGASKLALRLRVAPLIVGLTVVAMGTSAPELCVSIVAALGGNGGIAIGNVIGSNICNILLIVGASAVVAPIALTRKAVLTDMPVAVAAAPLLLVLCLDNHIGRGEGLLLLALFALYMAFIITRALRNKGTQATMELQTAPGPRETLELQGETRTRETLELQGETGPQVEKAATPILRCLLFIVLGLGCLIGGGELFVGSASQIATDLGIGETLVGLTIVAVGTSLPELATSIMAARKGQSALAIGNVIGSNVFNSLLIVGCAATISPFSTLGISHVDLATSVVAALLLWLFSYTELKVQRWEGAALLALFAAYMAYLIVCRA